MYKSFAFPVRTLLACAIIVAAFAGQAGAFDFTCTDSDSLSTFDDFYYDGLEVSIAVSPNDEDHMIFATNSKHVYVTTDGGTSWDYHVNGLGASVRNDPSLAIDSAGRMHLAFKGLVAYCDLAGDSVTAWTIDTSLSIYDKPHLTVDPNDDYVYVTWMSSSAEIKVARSTDRGDNWSAYGSSISDGVDAQHQNHGPNIQIGPEGNVYVVWAVYDSTRRVFDDPIWYTVSDDANALGFARSTNHGASWETSWRLPFDVRGTRYSWTYDWPDSGDKRRNIPAFPSMTVDQRSGALHLVWANISDTDDMLTDIYYSKSSSEGDSSSWATPQVVNSEDDDGVDNCHQWLPWISSDPETGWLSCFFFDNRHSASPSNNDARYRGRPYVAFSFNGGGTWFDCALADGADDGDNTLAPGAPPEYMGHAFAHSRAVTGWNSSDFDTSNVFTNLNPEVAITEYEIDTDNCCSGLRGNADNDANDQIDITDLSWLISYVYLDGPQPFCFEEADVNSDGVIDTLDIDVLVDYLFICLENCPPDSCSGGSGKALDDAIHGRLSLPAGFALGQNYPNPFNPATTFSFSIPESEHVTLEILDILGRRVTVLVDETLEAGHHEVPFDASGLASGVYLYRLAAGENRAARKMILLK